MITDLTKNESKATSVRKILDVIIDGQSKDIRLFTKGHLNEKNLYKQPRERLNNDWENAQKPKILQRPALLSNKTIDQSRDCVPLKSPTYSNRSRKSECQLKSTKDVYVEELKLPDIIVAKSQQLPKLSKSSARDEESYLKSDIEMAFKIIHNPLGGATKKDKLINMRIFEKDVLQINDLTKSNILFDTDNVKQLENKLRDNLSSLNTRNFNANFHRLQLYNNLFEEIIHEKNSLSDLLGIIKNEYDIYLNYLLDNQSQNSELIAQAERMRTSHFDKKIQINKMDQEIEDLEIKLDSLKRQEIDLNHKIKSEELFQIKKRKLNLSEHSKSSLESNSLKSNSISVFNKMYDLSDFNGIGKKIEITKESIFEKMHEINVMNEILNRDYVPLSVVNNLTQTIKDSDVEIQKLVSQNGFLASQIDDVENELKILLVQNDSTEFKEENVELLLKMIRSLDLMQTNKQRSCDQEFQPNEIQADFCNTYDDYFS